MTLQAWQVWTLLEGRQVDVLVAARSRAAASRLLGVSDHHLKTYGGETYNDESVAVANSAPGVVFWRESLSGRHKDRGWHERAPRVSR